MSTNRKYDAAAGPRGSFDRLRTNGLGSVRGELVEPLSPAALTPGPRKGGEKVLKQWEARGLGRHKKRLSTEERSDSENDVLRSCAGLVEDEVA